MAEAGIEQRKRGRKLPPLSQTMENESENEHVKKPRKKRTPRSPTDTQNHDENIDSPKDEAHSSGVKKKKKKVNCDSNVITFFRKYVRFV